MPVRNYTPLRVPRKALSSADAHLGNLTISLEFILTSENPAQTMALQQGQFPGETRKIFKMPMMAFVILGFLTAVILPGAPGTMDLPAVTSKRVVTSTDPRTREAPAPRLQATVVMIQRNGMPGYGRWMAASRQVLNATFALRPSFRLLI
jgi:hypothetical protein